LMGAPSIPCYSRGNGFKLRGVLDLSVCANL
jgi:hypothetical protein